MIVEDEDLDPRANAEIPLPDGQSDMGKLIQIVQVIIICLDQCCLLMDKSSRDTGRRSSLKGQGVLSDHLYYSSERR